MTNAELQGRHHRYPGLRSFGLEPLDHLLFFGRQQETRDLSQHILANRLTVVYGKSGLGKTSLLQAGVFPALRERGFLPLRVRLAGSQRDPMALLRSEVAAELAREKLLDPGVDRSEGESADTWWGFFKNEIFWRGTRVAEPCLVLDQFEEIFTLWSHSEREALAEQLSHLVNGTVPPSVLETMRAGQSSARDEPPAMRVVLSLRTEYVGRLQELFPRIPAILTRRFIIPPLDRERATRAICAPAELKGRQFLTPPFSYEKEALERVLDHLADDDSGEIEPYQLQLQCQEIEGKIIAQRAQGQREVRADRQLIGEQADLDGVVQGFYHDVLAGTVARARDGARGPLAAWRGKRVLNAARSLCEQGLLSGDGHRWQMNEGQILQDYPRLTQDQLDYLVEQRLLRREARGKAYVYELAHDSLAGPVFRQRASRLTPRARKQLMIGAFCAVTLVAGLFGYSLYLSSQKAALADKNVVLASQEQSATRTNEAYSDAARTRIEELLDQNRTLREELQGANDEIEQLIDRNDRTLQTLNEAREVGISAENAARAIGPLQEQTASLRKSQQQRVSTLEAAQISQLSLPEMVTIEGGSFRMGCLQTSACFETELPVREVRLAAFDISAHEVSFSNFDPFALETGRPLPDDEGWGREDRPVINVRWEDASAYATWFGQQTGQQCGLPTEAEWEYAARAGTKTRYSWGDDIGRNQANCRGCGSEWDKYRTAPVGSFEANPWGLYDMHGNVLEWVEDCWHDNYENAPTDGSVWGKENGGDCGRRVLRGGSWDLSPDDLRSASRGRVIPDDRFNSIGFRVVCRPH